MEIVLAALITAVGTVAAGAWRSTVKMNRTSNGSTSGEYVEQNHILLKILTRQIEDHVTNERLHGVYT